MVHNSNPTRTHTARSHAGARAPAHDGIVDTQELASFQHHAAEMSRDMRQHAEARKQTCDKNTSLVIAVTYLRESMNADSSGDIVADGPCHGQAGHHLSRQDCKPCIGCAIVGFKKS